MSAQRIVVLGAGYVGLTTSACLASLGFPVLCADIDAEKIERLQAGDVRIPEPGLHKLVADGLESGRLRFVLGTAAALTSPGHVPDIVFVCVPTPADDDGATDLSAIKSIVPVLREALPSGCVVVIKSTVPARTADSVREALGRDDVSVVSNPEFLREGSAVADFLDPDRVVVGSADPGAAQVVAKLYERFPAPVVITDSTSAELAKYAANCFLAVKLSYVNVIAELCELLGADIGVVMRIMGHDPRIGAAYLRPGPGWGGPCLPKDLSSLRHTAAALGVDLTMVSAAGAVNSRRQQQVVDKVRWAVGGGLAGVRVGLLGLSFKAGTADLRESPALAVAGLLEADGAILTAFDPGVDDAIAAGLDHLTVVDDPYLVAKNAAALVLLTDWPQFRLLDWHRIADLLDGDTVVDTRNHLDREVLVRAGLTCVDMGGRTPAR